MEILTGIFGNLLFISLFIFCHTIKTVSEIEPLSEFANRTTQVISELDIQILLARLEKTFFIGMSGFFLLMILGIKNLFFILGFFIFSWFFLSLRKFPLKFETYINVFINANNEVIPILKKSFFALVIFVGMVFLSNIQEKINIGNDVYTILLLLTICLILIIIIGVYMFHVVSDFLIAIPSIIITTSLLLSIEIAKLIKDINMNKFNIFCKIFLYLATILYGLKQYISYS